MTSNTGDGDSAKDTFVLLKILEYGEKQIRDGKVRPAADVLKDLLRRHTST